MNVIFISPNFPPQFRMFCSALRNRGAKALAVGDVPYENLVPELRAALTEYVHVPDMENYDSMLRAVGYLTSRHGKIDRIDSLNEHWLPLEAQLREDFNIPGMRPATLARQRSKSGMGEIFAAANVPYPDGELVKSPEQVRAFARRVGFPLVFKPDVGVGATGAFKVSNAEELEKALGHDLPGYLVQAFVPGVISTYDGLTDRNGRIIFDTSMLYGQGVMEVVCDGLDLFYYTRRQIPAKLAEMGKKVVEAFGIKERFFHIEFFELPDGTLKALEVNLRAPGGFTTDMMNFSYDMNVYDLWAGALSGADLSGFTFERKYHCAHVARREFKSYKLSHDEVCEKLGSGLVALHRLWPPVSLAMGEYVYLIRHPDEQGLLEQVKMIQAA